MTTPTQTDFGLRIADCGLAKVTNPHPHNPQSPTPDTRHPKPRSGISLTEVLISMGILTVGLLGVAALFPVGGFYMQKAEIADRGSAIAQAVMSDIVTRGMLNPGSWFVMIPSPRNGVATSAAPNTGFPADGKYLPLPRQQEPPPGTFARPFAEALGQALNQPAVAGGDKTLIGKQFGAALVIDPMGVAAMAFPGANQATQNTTASMFPAGANLVPSFSSYSSAWQPWVTVGPAGVTWPVRRVTFRQPDTAWQLNATAAEHYFRGNDELATDLPPRDDRPAQQNWDIADSGGAQLPLARQWAGNYSWLVTVVPTTNAARNGLARNPEGHTYDVSVVVFYKRVLPPGAAAVWNSSNGPIDFAKTIGGSERAVRARILSTGLNGGEILLDALADQIAESPFKNLKTGNWIMLCGPHPNSTPSEPRFVLNWYQVLSIEGRDARLNKYGTEAPAPPASDPERRLIAVRGPQWPWQPSSDPDDYYSVSNSLCVGILSGAVAVHTKTMRLESPSSSPVTFGSGGSHITNQNPWDFDT